MYTTFRFIRLSTLIIIVSIIVTSLFFTAEKGYYGIRVVTGKMITAGTSMGELEYVQIVGDKAASKKVYLTGLLTKIDAGSCEDLTIETVKTLGKIQVVILGMDENLIDDVWFPAYSEVYYLSYQADQAQQRFPCYHCIKQDKSVTTTSKASKHAYTITHPME